MSPMDIPHLLNSAYQFDYPFKFERDFDEVNWIDWMSANWTYSIPISLVYMVSIYAIKKYMEDRPRCDLRKYLAVWSFVLAIFSICCALRLMSEAIYSLYVHGWEYTVCFPTIYFGDTAIWAFLFTASKPIELGDTYFIVLRKQPLIFLHWYHHVTVMIYTSYTYGYYYAPGRWFAAVNSLVHAFMYSYYFLRAMKYRLPRFVNMFITTIQLLQMIFGMYVLVAAKQVVDRGSSCHVSSDNIKYGLLMYASYFALFAHFFYNTYVKPKTSKMASNGNGSSDVIKSKMAAVGDNEKAANGHIEPNGKAKMS